MADSSFSTVVTYRDVTVPEWVVGKSQFYDFTIDEIRNAFKAGVDAALNSPAPAPKEPTEFVGRVFVDDAGDEWHEQLQGRFSVYYPGQKSWSEYFLSEPEYRARLLADAVARVRGSDSDEE